MKTILAIFLSTLSLSLFATPLHYHCPTMLNGNVDSNPQIIPLSANLDLDIDMEKEEITANGIAKYGPAEWPSDIPIYTSPKYARTKLQEKKGLLYYKSTLLGGLPYAIDTTYDYITIDQNKKTVHFKQVNKNGLIFGKKTTTFSILYQCE